MRHAPALARGDTCRARGAKGIAGCPERKRNSACKRLEAPKNEADELRKLAEGSAEVGFRLEGEDDVVAWLASDILRADAEAARPEAESHRILADDECYRCLLTIPGVGPVLAEALVSLVDTGLYESHNQLTPLCGLAPADSTSGTSVDHTSTPRSGNKELRNLLIFTVNSRIGTKNYFGGYCEKVFEGTKGDPKAKRKKAPEAVARKRLKVIFAVMRDLTPYDPSRWEETA